MSSESINKTFQALANPVRRSIVDLLAKEPLSTGDICQHFDVSRYAIMKHLNILEEANLIHSWKSGREKVNFFNAIPLQELYRRWLDRFQAEDANSMINLKNLFSQREAENVMTNVSEKESFQIAQEITIKASKMELYQALTHDIDKWWSIRLFQHSKLKVDPTLGGQFYETTEDGKKALWGTLILIKPDEELHFNGALGMPNAVNSYYTYKLREVRPNETVLELNHTAFGFMDPSWEKDYREGWNSLLQDLKAYVEKL
ncbi:ArsR/SmtB family transcription factor [Salinibacillus xinjiangensis]|uniref:Helix-turn-helix domain-containing protein n=1 Tax=Salinibacillus xinjiangensis TaxID=1229268 RepID=A0A6G1X598_9BACI|nr:helix-turn-helix domain-containing protein [Salinibacillus xinjiangensis]MRG86076.1 helix-turn-helix domain-containing protein [Salinibacillus xinjiangensis]